MQSLESFQMQLSDALNDRNKAAETISSLQVRFKELIQFVVYLSTFMHPSPQLLISLIGPGEGFW